MLLSLLSFQIPTSSFFRLLLISIVSNLLQSDADFIRDEISSRCANKSEMSLLRCKCRRIEDKKEREPEVRTPTCMTSNAAGKQVKTTKWKKLKFQVLLLPLIISHSLNAISKERIKNRHSIDNKKQKPVCCLSPAKKKLKVWHKIDKKK